MAIAASNNIAGSIKRGRLSGLLNDWDLLLPSGDPYEDYGEYNEEVDGEEMNESERWKERQLIKRGWEGPVGQRIIIGILVTVAIFVRIWKLAVPAAVVFDEQHMGGFVRDYLSGKFFMDVHPPLGKLLYTAIARLQGFHEQFGFTRGHVKWVGLFTLVTIGLCLFKYLQESRKHLYLSMRDFSRQLLALCICLIILPSALYVGLFVIDFNMLSSSGQGDSWVSPQFRMTLKGHDVQPVMADIAWKSKIHLRHANTNGGWVHSMPGEYARDGTIDTTTRDIQSQKYIDREKNRSIPFDGYIYDGDSIQLQHCHSKVALAVHDLPSIASNKPSLREVRGVQWSKDIVPQTVWKLEIVPPGVIPGLVEGHVLSGMDITKDGDPSKQWHSINGFRLFNEKLNCYLLSHKVFRAPLSSYQEVGCVQGNRQTANTVFIVDRNVNPHLPEFTPSHSYRPLSFFRKFLEVNKVMWWSHHDLSSPIHADYHYSGNKGDQSHPGSWPFLRRGINYYSSKETNNYIYLIGNPLVWWATSAAAAMYMLGCLKSAAKLFKRESGLRVRREHFGLTPFYSIASGTFFVGWAIHYAPFFFMDHHLYLYQYLPSLYFSILLFVSRVDQVWQHWTKRQRYCTGLFLVLAVIYSWRSLSPLTYGTDFSSRSHCERVRSLGGWEFVCQRQNLAHARPQAAAAKIVIEDRAEHEKHEESEEKRNGQFYYQTSAMDLENDNKQGLNGQGDHEHDHEGPFKEEESEHYEHEHFRHPQEHGHADHNEAPVEHANNAADLVTNLEISEERRRLKAEKLALDARQKELEERLLARQRAYEQQLQARQQEQMKAQDSAGSSEDPSRAMPIQADTENQHTRGQPSTSDESEDGTQEKLRAQVLAMQGQIEYGPAV
ncbi:hypothetical protein BGZ72_004313 [Mortierella alpina]|nr:hypothetical protein BGZ72_004313 [Mortierella alpina]